MGARESIFDMATTIAQKSLAGLQVDNATREDVRKSIKDLYEAALKFSSTPTNTRTQLQAVSFVLDAIRILRAWPAMDTNVMSMLQYLEPRFSKWYEVYGKALEQLTGLAGQMNSRVVRRSSYRRPRRRISKRRGSRRPAAKQRRIAKPRQTAKPRRTRK